MTTFIAACLGLLCLLSATAGGADRRSCLYEGVWHTEGEAVMTREPCLRCVCAAGVLHCRRRACAPLPDPLPHRCHTVHRKRACCPELHCPEGVSVMEHAAARLESDDLSEIATSSALHGCVESGTVYAEGSALVSPVPCVQCFCLGGARRCVSPRCLPPPPGCKPRPSPGACCPSRYYCEHTQSALSTRSSGLNPHDCLVDGRRVTEGEPVEGAGATCAQCYCLRGAVRCQPLSCAPPLLGCRPVLRPGHCCPHQYQCHRPQHHGSVDLSKSPKPPSLPSLPYITDNELISTKNEDRSFHTSKPDNLETSTKILSIVNTVTRQHREPEVRSTKKQSSITTKVKRKTNDASETTSHKPIDNNSTNIPTTIETSRSTIKLSKSEHEAVLPVQSGTTQLFTTEQPDSTVRIIINSTTNCTAELSSTPVLLYDSKTDSDHLGMTPDVHPVTNIDRLYTENHTFNPNDIITDRSVNTAFDDSDMFTINVTSSLRTNTSQSTSSPGSVISISGPYTYNISKKTKDNYDYDYSEATLPPSLPNLKIIPFVAADAVVDDDESPATEGVAYPSSSVDREHKYPVYLPDAEVKETPFANRRQDVYNPMQYPVFTSGKIESSKFSTLKHEVDMSNYPYPNTKNDLASLFHDYNVATTVRSHLLDISTKGSHVTKTPANTKYELETPSVNLFSPPVETEGGFIPKGPGIAGEYYAVYPSTAGPAIPHLTTSMLLDIHKDECRTVDGRRVPDGESISLSCSVCACAWGELHCSPRDCHTPAGCHRRPASRSAEDLCCGELVCRPVNATIAPVLHTSTVATFDFNINTTSAKIESTTEIVQSHDTTEKSSPKSNNTSSSLLMSGDDDSPKGNVMDVTLSNETKHFDKTFLITDTKTTIVNITTQKPIISTNPIRKNEDLNEQTNGSGSIEQPSQEYEDEEEEDEGFSFGSVLKLLLSDSYDTTTAAPVRRKTTAVVERTEPSTTKSTTTTQKPTTAVLRASSSTTTVTTGRPSPKPSPVSFMTLPNIYPPSKKIPPKSINRIEHLVLGETSSIKKSTNKPFTTPNRPIVASRRPFPTTTRPPDKDSRPEDNFVGSNRYTSVNREGPHLTSPGVGAGLLKLAGCNIYGKIYRVGRIIAELSTPCLECRCTEVGVQCRALEC